MPRSKPVTLAPLSFAPPAVPAPNSRRSLPRESFRPEPVGRYDGRGQRTIHPATGLARMPRSKNRDEVVAAVPDPFGTSPERIYATVNRRVDILETERSRGLISEDAYRAGRDLQDVLERASSTGSCNWDATPRDRETVQRAMLARAMERSQDVQRVLTFVQARLGAIDTRLLRRVLGDWMSYADCAALRGKAGERGVSYVAARFRDALEDLAAASAAKGAGRHSQPDKHQVASEGAGTRQDLSAAAGGTLGRLERELAELEEQQTPATAEISRARTAVADQRLRQATARAHLHRA